MQDYYNYISKFAIGGLIKLIARVAGRAKIQGHANLLSKSHPELSKLLSKLARSLKGGEKLTEEESKKLVTLALNYRRNNIHYLNRRKKITELLATRRQPTQEGTPSGKNAPTNPVPGTTLSARWKLAKEWMNNHPKLTVGVPLLTLGTGPGRYITGNALKFTQSNPESWFGNSPATPDASDFVMMPDGTKIPIKKSAEGYFVPVALDNNQIPSAEGDSIDQTLAGITNENLGGTPLQQSGNMPQIDQLAINDLFDDDQWL